MDTHDAPFTGVLQREHLAAIARWLPAPTKFIAKMNDKAAIMPSVSWIEQAIAH
jgi:hypothetical protein